MEERIIKCLEAAFADFSSGEKPKAIAPTALSRFYLMANTYLQRQNLVPRGVRHFVKNTVNSFLEQAGYRRIHDARYDYGGYILAR